MCPDRCFALPASQDHGPWLKDAPSLPFNTAVRASSIFAQHTPPLHRAILVRDNGSPVHVSSVQLHCRLAEQCLRDSFLPFKTELFSGIDAQCWQNSGGRHASVWHMERNHPSTLCKCHVLRTTHQLTVFPLPRVVACHVVLVCREGAGLIDILSSGQVEDLQIVLLRGPQPSVLVVNNACTPQRICLPFGMS